MWVWRVIAFLVCNGGGEYRDDQAVREQPSKQSEQESRGLFASHGFCLEQREMGNGKEG